LSISLFPQSISFLISQNDAEQINTIAHHAKSLPLLLNDLIEEQATNEPARYRQQLDTLLSRFKQLCVATEETSQYCTIIIKAKAIHENTSQLNTLLGNISNTSVQFRDVSDVRNALQEQIHVCESLQKLSQQVNELITRGNELIRQPSVPKYVQQDIQNIQKLYNEKVQSANDLLGKLKVNNRIKLIWIF
jgi:hypothetical protein